MRIGDPERNITLYHELVLSARIRAFKAKLLEISNQILAFDRAKRRHLGDIFDRKLQATHFGEWQILGNPEQDPFFEDLFKFLSAVFES